MVKRLDDYTERSGNMGSKHRRSGLVLAAIALTVGAFIAQAPSAVAEPAPSTASPATVLGHWYTYYDNYFYSLYTCESRGEWMVANVNGIIDYQCWQGGGDLKWSMDVYDTYA